jgi:hypothetical protein
MIKCGTFAALIGRTILSISELAAPCQGAVVVSDEPFRFVQSAMAADDAGVAKGGNRLLKPGIELGGVKRIYLKASFRIRKSKFRLILISCKSRENTSILLRNYWTFGRNAMRWMDGFAAVRTVHKGSPLKA